MNRHLKGFIASVVVIALCTIVAIATFSQAVWYGVFPLALGIFFLIKFAIPSWKEYKEETTPKRDNPILHNIPSNEEQRIKVNLKEPATSGAQRIFLDKCESLIREYEASKSFGAQSCVEEMMASIKKTIPQSFTYDDLEKQSRFVLVNRCGDLLSSGEFHFHSASLNPKGEAIYRVYNGCSQWLLDNKHITQDEFNEYNQALRKSISEVG